MTEENRLALVREELARVASRMQRDREDADYDIGAVFTPETAAAILADAERFCAQARALLGG